VIVYLIAKRLRYSGVSSSSVSYSPLCVTSGTHSLWIFDQVLHYSHKGRFHIRFLHLSNGELASVISEVCVSSYLSIYIQNMFMYVSLCVRVRSCAVARMCTSTHITFRFR